MLNWINCGERSQLFVARFNLRKLKPCASIRLWRFGLRWALSHFQIYKMQKYQVFISSTYDDLKSERSQVIKAVLEMGHIPVGMEMFSAADEEQWKIITRQIDDSDYYVIIVGHRYGSLSGKISYTEKEFDYAQSKGIPIYGFVIDSTVEPLAKNIEKDKAKIAGLSKFKTKVKQRPVSFWSSADDLQGKVSIALMKAFNTNPRPGWVRASSSAGPEVTQELSRLSKENAELRSQLVVTASQDADAQLARISTQIDLMKAVPFNVQIKEKDKAKWDLHVKSNLFDIFSTLASQMIDELSVTRASKYLAIMYSGGKPVAEFAPIATNHINEIFADLACLGLISPSKKKHAVSDKEIYWSLTEQGLETLKLNRISNLELKATSTTKKLESIKSS